MYTPAQRASTRLGIVLLVVIGVLLTVALFYVKTGAKETRTEVKRLERQLAEERAAVDVLRAERAVLANPARLRELGESRLGLAPIRPDATRTTLEVTP